MKVTARILIGLGAVAMTVAGPPVRAQQPPRFGERVDVARIIVDARVLDEEEEVRSRDGWTGQVPQPQRERGRQEQAE